jgi:hypothetical protein
MSILRRSKRLMDEALSVVPPYRYNVKALLHKSHRLHEIAAITCSCMAEKQRYRIRKLVRVQPCLGAAGESDAVVHRRGGSTVPFGHQTGLSSAVAGHERTGDITGTSDGTGTSWWPSYSQCADANSGSRWPSRARRLEVKVSTWWWIRPALKTLPLFSRSTAR